jgi:hypothetical protein
VAARQVFYCWNTLNDFEVNQIAAIKAHMQELKIAAPENFNDREWLKFL